MSFILDALKRSEAERQDQAGGEFSSVPAGAEPGRSKLWLWLLGGLLTINLAVLVGILLRPGVQPPPAEPATRAPATAAADIETELVAGPDKQAAATAQPATSFADRVASVRQTRAETEATALPAAAGSDTRLVAGADAQPATATQSAPPTPSGAVPSIDELRLDGSLTLPDLHVDIHVYSDDPAERFVFINMVKHREGSTLAEGPVVRRITVDGAVLEYRGRSFLLPRE